MKNIRKLTALMAGIVLAGTVVSFGTTFKFDPNKDITVTIPEDCKVNEDYRNLAERAKENPTVTVSPLERNLPVFFDGPSFF